jgi:hypothetical protein
VARFHPQWSLSPHGSRDGRSVEILSSWATADFCQNPSMLRGCHIAAKHAGLTASGAWP